MRIIYILVLLGVLLGLMNPVFAYSSYQGVKKSYNAADVKKKHKRQKISKVKKKSIGKKSFQPTVKPYSKSLAKQKVKQNKLKRKKIIKNTRYQRVVNNGAIYYGSDQLAYRINQLIRENADSADIGVYVRSMRYGDQLYARSVAKPLTPASTLKVMTAEAAFIYLKPDYRFTTRLLTNAKNIKNGILQGNLYIVLSGDPSLTYQDISNLMPNLRAQGIYGISGNVYIDHTAYDRRFYGPDWEDKDKNYCYAAPISAGIINHNCLPVKLAPAKTPGRAAIIETSSRHFYPTIRNGVITTSYRSRSCGLRLSNDLSTGLEINGCVAKGQNAFGVSYVVTDVSEYNRALFKNVLRQSGIEVQGNVTFGSSPSNLSMIAYHSSRPLSELVNEMLKKSDNIIAGALFKKIGQLYTGRPGSWENGSYAVSRILANAARISTRNMRILDGSGLSPSNSVTPEQMMQVLDYAYHHSSAEDFISALPIAGVDGTLKHRMGHLARKVRAKTGTISGVVSLAGYVNTIDKEDLAFVILVNGKKGMMWKYRELEDNIVTALAKYKR